MKPSDTVAMTVEEALTHSDEWTKGQTFYPGAQGWRVVCAVLAAEVRRLRAGMQKANEQAARFEREWYLRGDEIERLRNALQRLIDVAEQCDSWESFPSKALEDAEKALEVSSDNAR